MYEIWHFLYLRVNKKASYYIALFLNVYAMIIGKFLKTYHTLFHIHS